MRRIVIYYSILVILSFLAVPFSCYYIYSNLPVGVGEGTVKDTVKRCLLFRDQAEEC